MNKSYIPEIDGMRAIAISIVVVSHFGAERFLPGGFGVTLFFFISGYLITRLLIQEKNSTAQIAIPSFYARRFLRLGPALMTMITVVSVAYFLVVGSVNKSQILACVFYYANYYGIYGGASPMPFAPLWSLAVEEHYYLIYPLIFAVTWKRREQFLTGLILLTIAVLVWRVVLVVHWMAPEARTYYATDTRIDSILYGAILAVIPNTRFAFITRYFENWAVITVATLTLLLTFLYRDPTFRETFRYSLQGMAILPLFYAVLVIPGFSLARVVLRFPTSLWIGRLSYSIYLYHFPVLFFVAKLPIGNLALSILADMLATLAAATLSYYCIERRFRKLRNRFRGTRAKHYAAQKFCGETNLWTAGG